MTGSTPALTNASRPSGTAAKPANGQPTRPPATQTATAACMRHNAAQRAHDAPALLHRPRLEAAAQAERCAKGEGDHGERARQQCRRGSEQAAARQQHRPQENAKSAPSAARDGHAQRRLSGCTGGAKQRAKRMESDTLACCRTQQSARGQQRGGVQQQVEVRPQRELRAAREQHTLCQRRDSITARRVACLFSQVCRP